MSLYSRARVTCQEFQLENAKRVYCIASTDSGPPRSVLNIMRHNRAEITKSSSDS